MILKSACPILGLCNGHWKSDHLLCRAITFSRGNAAKLKSTEKSGGGGKRKLSVSTSRSGKRSKVSEELELEYQSDDKDFEEDLGAGKTPVTPKGRKDKGKGKEKSDRDTSGNGLKGPLPRLKNPVEKITLGRPTPKKTPQTAEASAQQWPEGASPNQLKDLLTTQPLPFDSEIIQTLAQLLDHLPGPENAGCVSQKLTDNIKHINFYHLGQSSLPDEGVSWGHGVLAGDKMISTDRGQVSGGLVYMINTGIGLEGLAAVLAALTCLLQFALKAVELKTAKSIAIVKLEFDLLPVFVPLLGRFVDNPATPTQPPNPQLQAPKSLATSAKRTEPATGATSPVVASSSSAAALLVASTKGLDMGMGGTGEEEVVQEGTDVPGQGGGDVQEEAGISDLVPPVCQPSASTSTSPGSNLNSPTLLGRVLTGEPKQVVLASKGDKAVLKAISDVKGGTKAPSAFTKVTIKMIQAYLTEIAPNTQWSAKSKAQWIDLVLANACDQGE